jgi:hypothetical protein
VSANLLINLNSKTDGQQIIQTTTILITLSEKHQPKSPSHGNTIIKNALYSKSGSQITIRVFILVYKPACHE